VKWTETEDAFAIGQRALGATHAAIASQLPGRTEDAVKGRLYNITPNRAETKAVKWTETEDAFVISQRALGATHAAIASRLSGRTEDAVEARWMRYLKPDRKGRKPRRARPAVGKQPVTPATLPRTLSYAPEAYVTPLGSNGPHKSLYSSPDNSIEPSPNHIQ